MEAIEAVLAYIMKDLQPELFSELMETMIGLPYREK